MRQEKKFKVRDKTFNSFDEAESEVDKLTVDGSEEILIEEMEDHSKE